MHPLQNGSQVEVKPTAKNLIGNPGYFSESGEGGKPSYPGADWFNANIDEVQNLLAAAGLPFEPLKFDHLARVFSKLVLSDEKASEEQAVSADNNEAWMTPYLSKVGCEALMNAIGLGMNSPPLLDNINSMSKPNGSIWRTYSSTEGDFPPGMGKGGVVRYERWGDNDVIQYWWHASDPDASLFVRRYKASSGIQQWMQVFHSGNMNPYKVVTLHDNPLGDGNGTLIDWTGSGMQLSSFKSVRITGYWVESGQGFFYVSTEIPTDIALSITGNKRVHIGGFTAKGTSSSDLRLSLKNFTEMRAEVEVLAQGYSGAITRIEGISY